MADEPHRELIKLLSDAGDKVIDSYPNLIRVGAAETWSADWEAFRDLAGPLDPGALPIVIRMEAGGPSTPVADHVPEPLDHVRIVVTPEMDRAAVADTWIGALIKNDVLPTFQPADFFHEALGIEPERLAPSTRGFLGLDLDGAPVATPDAAADRAEQAQPPPTWPEWSASTRNVRSQLDDDKPITALAIVDHFRRNHPEYAGGDLGRVQLPTEAVGVAHPPQVWWDSVAALYDETAVRNHGPGVIDGRLFLYALGAMEGTEVRSTLDDANVWYQLVLEIDERALTHPTLVAARQMSLRYNYDSDAVAGVDRLGITVYVDALSELITDRETKPPLAVGLFGNWGSGKSFFMEQMRRRVHHLVKVEHRQGRIENVTQIRFNAWHYADTSLWASLAVEIFERLADPEPVDDAEHQRWLAEHGDDAKQKREALLEQLESFKQARTDLETRSGELESKRAETIREVTRTERLRDEAVEKLQLRDVAAVLQGDAVLSQKRAELDEYFGESPDIRQIRSTAAELSSTVGYVRHALELLIRRPLAALLAIVILTVGALAVAFMADGRLLGTALSAGAAAAGLVAGWARVIHPTIERVNAFASRVDGARIRADEVLEEHAAEHEIRIAKAQAELGDIDAKLQTLRGERAMLDAKLLETNSQLDNLDPRNQLYEFLTSRADGYQSHQGVVGMLHRDFRMLDRKLRSARTTSGATSGPLPSTERVVLYIDDLDRCPPDKVLEVLEAVHLLMALELFIVVVGVDPRWLTRSLRHQYRHLDDSNGTDGYLDRMPTEYLEKIFQVPLTLAAMDAKGFHDLVESLAPPTFVEAAQESPATPRTPPTESPGPIAPAAKTPEGLIVQAGSTIAANEPVDLTPSELAFLKELHELVDSPRSTKRLVNTYRMIRSTRHVGSASQFLGYGGSPGQFYAVLSLLAAAAGHTRIVDVLHEYLAADETRRGWKAFVESLDPNPPTLDSQDHAEWNALIAGLASTLEANQLDDLAIYQQWAQITSRFSFAV